MTHPSPLPLRGAAAFAMAYAALTLAGRLTIHDGQQVSLVWPAAGVAVLWMLAESPRRPLRALVPLVLVHAGINGLTGASWGLILFGSLSIGVQTWLVVLLLRRWCPTMLGAGGTESLRTPRTLAIASAATIIGCAIGAAVGPVGLLLDGAPTGPSAVVAWFARHVAGILTVGGVGHLAWEWHTQAIPPRAMGGSRFELVLLWVTSIATTVTVFLLPYPLTFVVMAFSVWAGARFRSFPAALLCLVLGSISLALSLDHRGPFAGLTGAVAEALVSQAFMMIVLLTGLGVGALSDRIDDLFAAATRSRREAREQAELLGEMTESMGEGLIVLDRRGRVDRSNGASRRLAHRVSLGASDDDALAALVDLVLRPAPAHTGAERAEIGVGDVVIPLPSGEEIILAVTRTSLSGRDDDGRSGVLLVLREVTEHRSGLRPLAGFASTAAHDLRTPLSAIRSWLSLAVDDLEPGSDARGPLLRAERSAAQMADLIGDLLTHALAESGELVGHDTPLGGPSGVLAQTVALLGPDDVLEVPDDLPAVHADPVAMRQLFGNLVGNAVKYAKPGRPARIQVRAVAKGSRVVVEIEDDGVGVDDEERALIFQRFHRSGAVRAHFRGTGMGLSICRTIVQRHGGTIECLATPPGTGTVFRFDLPAASAGQV
jgi:signal transduction histidine kinase